MKNLTFQKADFQDLPFQAASFDLVFELESVCHAPDKKTAFEEIFRVLRPGRKAVFFDGFRKTGFDKLSEDLKKAARLVEVTMAVGYPWCIDDTLRVVEDVGFEIVQTVDISKAIMPNLLKFQTLASRYFDHPRMARLILSLYSPTVVRNAIAGLLMPYTIESNAHGYYKIILEKK